ncbi:MAG TPA: hypothetical protein DD435_10770 [Cyanobacteria bacterium UBA8530]|nr:hypothetical protein [Cyanobacteria bacterium UBA8530]
MQLFYLTCFIFGVLFTAVSFFGLIDDLSDGHSALHWGPFHLSLPGALAFTTWFGAVGYLLLGLSAFPLPLIFLLAFLAGGFSGLLVNLFLAKVRAGDRKLDPQTYRLEGRIAHVTVGIPENGVGEIVLTLAGSRRSEAASSTDGRAIPHGAEVAITDYRHGVAIVHPMDSN